MTATRGEKLMERPGKVTVCPLKLTRLVYKQKKFNTVGQSHYPLKKNDLGEGEKEEEEEEIPKFSLGIYYK